MTIADSSTLFWVTGAYLALVIGVSIWGYRYSKTEEEFLVAGRSIGPWVGGAVLAATQISAGTFVGTLGRYYQTGVSWGWAWFGVWAGWVVSAVFVAPKLRKFGALTVADYVGTRFASEHARTIAAVLIIICYSILLTAQFQAIGEIASAVFGITPTHGDGAAAGEHGVLHRCRRRPVELVHRLRADADHDPGADFRGPRGVVAHRRGDGAGRVHRVDRAARDGMVVHVAGDPGHLARLRAWHRRRAVRDDALLLDARRLHGALRHRRLDCCRCSSPAA